MDPKTPKLMKKKKTDPVDELEALLHVPAEVDDQQWQQDIERDPIVNQLTYRQKLFAIHFCQGMTATKAAIAAGYSENGAHVRANDLLKHEGVQLMILRRQQALAAASNVTRERIMVELGDIIEEIRMSRNPDRNLQLKVLDMLAKMNGMYQPDFQVNVQNNIESVKIEIVRPNAIENPGDTSI